MPRAMRVEYPGAIYHVMDRGDRQEDLFVDDVNAHMSGEDWCPARRALEAESGWPPPGAQRRRLHVQEPLTCPQDSFALLISDGLFSYIAIISLLAVVGVVE